MCSKSQVACWSSSLVRDEDGLNVPGYGSIHATSLAGFADRMIKEACPMQPLPPADEACVGASAPPRNDSGGIDARFASCYWYIFFKPFIHQLTLCVDRQGVGDRVGERERERQREKRRSQQINIPVSLSLRK